MPRHYDKMKISLVKDHGEVCKPQSVGLWNDSMDSAHTEFTRDLLSMLC